MREIIAAAREITGQPIRAKAGARRAGDPPVLVADASLAHRELGWTPRHSGVEEMIGTAWRWLGKRELLLDQQSMES